MAGLLSTAAGGGVRKRCGIDVAAGAPSALPAIIHAGKDNHQAEKQCAEGMDADSSKRLNLGASSK